MIKLANPWFDEAEHAAVREVLASGQLVQGQRVRRFETLLAERVGAAHAVMVSSGTAALHLTLLACDIGPGDAVIVPDYTFVATANVVALAGATPVFVDVDTDTYNMDASQLRDVVEHWVARRSDHAPKLKMILPVHQFGLPAEMDAIREIADRHSLLLVEDAACALGARYRDRPVGSWGVASCYSFHPRKVLTTGEGGAVVTNDAVLAQRIQSLRAHGFASMPGPRPELVACGFNYRMTEMQAAIGIEQMGKLDEILSRRRRLAALLQRELEGISWFKSPVVSSDVVPNWQSFVGVVQHGVNREALIDRLAARGVETRPPATAIHQLGPYRRMPRFGEWTFPVSEMLESRALALPLHPGMDEAHVMRVAREIKSAPA